MRIRLTFLVLVAVILLVGCSTVSPILKVNESESYFNKSMFKGHIAYEAMDSDNIEGERYRLYHRGASGFVPFRAVRNSAIAKAERFCKNNGGKMRIISERIENNIAMPGNFPKIEIIFVCEENLEESKPEERLEELKSLYDKGLISEAEYEANRKTILHMLSMGREE